MSTTDQAVAEQVKAFNEQLAAQAPEEILSVYGAERAALNRAGVPALVPAPGIPMPDGHLLDVNGSPTTLAAARNGRPAVIITYRGEWCPYCNLWLSAYQQRLVPKLQEFGVELIAVSPQKPDGSLTMKQKHDLTFTVLSDPGNQISRQLGLLNPPRTDEVRAADAALGVDVASANADGTDVIAMPAAIIVDASGIIRWIDVHPDYSVRTEPEVILGALTKFLS
jgi:peroxiredoxin